MSNPTKTTITREYISKGVFKHCKNLEVMGRSMTAFVNSFYRSVEVKEDINAMTVDTAIRKCDSILNEAANAKQELLKIKEMLQ